MDSRLGMEAQPSLSANDQLRLNLRELLDMRRMTQADLAHALGVSQPWVSKRLSGVTPFQIEDVDSISAVFGLSPAQMMCVGFGALDRRKSVQDRRGGEDRRRNPLPYSQERDR